MTWEQEKMLLDDDERCVSPHGKCDDYEAKKYGQLRDLHKTRRGGCVES